MDLQYFLNILWRRKWLILTVMLVAAAATYFFVNRKSDTYNTDGIITTSIVGRGVDPREEKPWIMEYYVNMGFENQISAMTSKRYINFLTSRLLLHDLSGDTLSVGNEPFRRLSEMEDVDLSYAPAEIQDLLDTLQYKVDNLVYRFSSPEQEQMFNDLAEALSYDYENIMKYNLKVGRDGDTDNLKIEFESENPKLCAFAVNTFAEDYVRLYKDDRKDEGDSNVDFYQNEADAAKTKLTQLQSKLNNYRAERKLYDAGDESQVISTRRNQILKDLEIKRAQVPALEDNIKTLDRLIRQKRNETNSVENTNKGNNVAITNLQETIQELNEKIIASGGKDKESIKAKELMEMELEKRLEKIADLQKPIEELPDTKQTEQGLFDQKVKLQLELSETNQRITSLENDLIKITDQQRNLVTDDAIVKDMEAEITIARNDYIYKEEKLSEAKLKVNNTFQPVKILEYAQIPDEPESKNKAILTAFAGIVGGVLSTVAIFLMAFLDTTINSSNKFKKFAKVDLLGTVNKVKTDNLDLKYLFSSNGQNKKLDTFKESLRNIRYQIESSNANRFLFTSTKKQEGKTFMIVTLAHALTIKDKKILIVDTNFKNNTLTQMSNQSIEENLLNSQLLGENDLDKEFVSQSIHDPFNLENVDIIGNKGSYQSPSEVFAGKDFDKFLDGLEKQYDYIFFEGSAMNKYSDTKELVQYVDKVIAVFNSENDINAADQDSIDYLKGLGNKFMGAVLNKMDLKNLA